MRFDKVDLAWYGNKSAMEAVDRAGGEIFAQTVAANGAPGYWSLMIVNKESPYDSVDEVLDHAGELTFGNGDPNSTSGYLVPGYYVFAKNHVDPATAFKRTLNSNHETNALTVANGQVDVATFNTESMERLEITHPDKADQLKVIWKSPLIPSDPLVWRTDLPQETKDELRQFFLSYGDTDKQKNNRSNSMPGALRVVLTAGDAVAFNPLALHRGRYHADRPRRTLMLTYTSAMYPRFDYFSDQPWFDLDGYLEGLDMHTAAFFEDFVHQYGNDWRKK